MKSRRSIPRSHAPLGVPLATVAGLLFIGLVGCGGSARSMIKDPSGLDLPIEIEHEPCDISNGEAIDVNGDGRPDIVRVRIDGREVCRMVDLNFDGRPDTFIYFDDEGRVRRRESDFDRDGRVDEIAIYEGGVIVRKDRDTNLDGKFDTWDLYENGRLTRRLRDTRGRGQISQSWSFPDPDRPDCAIIRGEGDGLLGEDDVVDTCAGEREPMPVSESAQAAEKAPGDDEAAEASEDLSEEER